MDFHLVTSIAQSLKLKHKLQIKTKTTNPGQNIIPLCTLVLYINKVECWENDEETNKRSICLPFVSFQIFLKCTDQLQFLVQDSFVLLIIVMKMVLVLSFQLWSSPTQSLAVAHLQNSPFVSIYNTYYSDLFPVRKNTLLCCSHCHLELPVLNASSTEMGMLRNDAYLCTGIHRNDAPETQLYWNGRSREWSLAGFSTEYLLLILHRKSKKRQHFNFCFVCGIFGRLLDLLN